MISSWMHVTAVDPVKNWPTLDISSQGASRATAAPTGTSGLADAAVTKIKGVVIGSSNSTSVLTFYAHDGTTVLRTINATGVLATNLAGNTNWIEFEIPGGFAVTTDSGGGVDITIMFEYAKKWTS
jgi:hypothetical protein